jgi:hypothetical protein
MSDTTSTAGMYQTLRTRLLTYQPPDSAPTLASRLTDLFINAAPDDVAYPYGTMRLLNRDEDGAYNGDREATDLEVMLYHRPRAKAMDLEACGDVCDQAMKGYADATSGLLFSRSRQRDTLPQFPEPADREIVGIRLLYPVVAWPRLLTDVAA